MADLTSKEWITTKTYDGLVKNGILKDGWQKYHPADYWNPELTRFHKLLPKGSVLEVGAGGGQHAKKLIDLGYKYTGTDISEELLKIAHNYLPGQKFLLQSVYDLNFNEKFDGFWAAAILLHVPKERMDEALSRIKSVVKHGGVGFISLIEGNGEGVRYEDFEGQKHKRFFSFWRMAEFEKVLEKNGYKLVDFSSRPKSSTENWLCFFVEVG
ncbi:MAG TPA: class I SAM-dependent methyltransferase [Candidatus Saccharimonadales bacterium]|nr:class I SAM-dependent methyltransferase [Candidatus Saccharimonadales bacterium]